jgi:hypothetical protein
MKITLRNLRSLIQESILNEGIADVVKQISEELNAAGYKNRVASRQPRKWTQGVSGSSTGYSYYDPSVMLAFEDSATRDSALANLTSMGFQKLPDKKPIGTTGSSTRVFFKKGRYIMTSTTTGGWVKDSKPAIGIQSATVLRNPYWVDA